jgi:bacteriocin-like protein
MSKGMRELTTEELSTVSGGTIVEFSIGPAALQFNTSNGGYSLWNGHDLAGHEETLIHEPVHGTNPPRPA